MGYSKNSYREIIAERLNVNNLRCSEGVPLGKSEDYSEWVVLTAKWLNVKYCQLLTILHSTAPQLYAFSKTLSPLIASGVIHIQSLRDFNSLFV